MPDKEEFLSQRGNAVKVTAKILGTGLTMAGATALYVKRPELYNNLRFGNTMGNFLNSVNHHK